MRSSAIRILLDSTYLLPILGVDVEGVDEALRVLKGLRSGRRAEFYYTEFNLIEVLGKIGRTDYDRGRVLAGLNSIEEEFRLTRPTVEGYLRALALRRVGFRDLIDLLLYATSLTRDLLFLTRDDHLIEFLEGRGEDTRRVLHERSLIEEYGGG
ncbi:MAG: PIN domain-containing protein [Candidatus Korarchaeota archaeon]|nr:PIN domain-containing protein [Candidatus Korarchaeota archaeon]